RTTWCGRVRYFTVPCAEDAVVEDQHHEVLRFEPPYRGEHGRSGVEGSLALDREDAAARTGERNPEPDRRRVAELHVVDRRRRVGEFVGQAGLGGPRGDHCRITARPRLTHP